MKRWIHTSTDEGYTNFISEEIPESVQLFLDSDHPSYSVVKEACNDFWSDYEKFPSSNTMESLNMEYDKDKVRFYKKYRPFVDACKNIMKTINPSGYGREDYMNLKIKDMLRSVDYNFPYGWKNL